MTMKLKIRQMTRNELDQVVQWASKEGWNPGLADAEIFWNTDPGGFVVAELDGKMVGSGSIISYNGDYGFMGFFIMQPEYRNKGLGTELWCARKELLLARLKNPLIGMDGVFNMQPFYIKGGFEFYTREIRFEYVGQKKEKANYITELKNISFDDIFLYDSNCFPASREKFLNMWINQKNSICLGAIKDNKLCGYSVMRKCYSGYKIGPLFADDAKIAEDLFVALSSNAMGAVVQLDIPENNNAAIAMAKKYNMKEVFGCAKMYHGTFPKLPDNEIFGITTFELG
ncbi:MAG: GNAT family N-acetyltransferase [Pseudomonadota bacterium]